MSEEPTWEVCRKLVGCPIISRLIFGRCLLNMVRMSLGSVWWEPIDWQWTETS